MTKKLTLEVIDFIEGTTMVVDEHPIVNDKDYVDVIQTPNELKYLLNGEYNSITETNATYEQLLEKAIETAVWNEWFYNCYGEDKQFNELKLSAPSVETEEGIILVKNIGQFINNGKTLLPITEYNKVKQQLLEIAKTEVEIIVKGEKTNS